MTFVQIAPASAAAQPASMMPAHVEVAQRYYDNLEAKLESDTGTYWSYFRPADGRPCFSSELLRDIRTMQADIQRLCAERAQEPVQPVRYYVLGSRIPGVYNLGGDLAHFAAKIREGDRESLRRYGHVCVEAIYNNAIAFDAPVVTIALVQGDALGGGFECALAFDVIVAERSAKFGLPEILFNLFPGMGAMSFLSRRLGPVQAERMIMSGKIYTAEELHAMGLVDVLAEDGQGEAAGRDYIDRHGRRHNAHRAIYQARRIVNPVTLEELRKVVDTWVDAALNLTDVDLRKMLRLTAAQGRRMAAVVRPVMMAAE